MKLSWNWISELVDVTPIGTPEKLAEILTARGLEVEEVNRADKGLGSVVTGLVVERGQHPQSDRLSYCQIDVGTGTILNIVCGATNHKTGDKVAVALMGADLPNGMKIGKSKIRGVESEGMLCSESELGLSKESEGILILPKDTKVGLPIAGILGKNDVTLEIKLYANQGNLLSHVGVAREIAAHLSLQTGKSPETFFSRQKLKHIDGDLFGSAFNGANSIGHEGSKKAPIQISLEVVPGCDQFVGVAIEGVKIGPSPSWLVSRLESLGSRSINNVVDATNLILFELGHPVHAYDLKNLKGQKIRVRLAKEGEHLPLLDGSELKLSGGELVIGDAERAIGLAGVMGGGNTEVSDSTTSVYLECAQFDPVLVRQSKVRYQKLTEAAARFEKGVDPEGLEFVMRRLTALVIDLAGGKVIGGEHLRRLAPTAGHSVRLDVDYIPSFLGISTTPAEVKKILETLSCTVTEKRTDHIDEFHVLPPSYRLDLRIKQDLAEEVARSIGYDKIPSTIPVLTSPPKLRGNSEAILLDRAKDAFVRIGFSEALNYSFTSQSALKSFGMESSLKLLNPLSEEFEAMVPSLLPGLLSNVQSGFRHHFGSEVLSLKLFEIRPTFSIETPAAEIRAISDTETGVQENWKCAFLMTGERFGEALRKEAGTIDFFDLKAALQNFFEVMGTKGVRFISLENSRTKRTPQQTSLAALFHPGISTEILLGNESLGVIGKLHPKVGKSMKLKQEVYLGELDWKLLSKMSRTAYQAKSYSPWLETPAIERDFAFVVDAKITAEQIVSSVLKASKPLAKSARVFDVYRGAPVPEGKASVAVRVILQDKDRSLQETEVEPVSKAIIAALQKEFSAELR